jgi:hypothetical protein
MNVPNAIRGDGAKLSVIHGDRGTVNGEDLLADVAALVSSRLPNVSLDDPYYVALYALTLAGAKR